MLDSGNSISTLSDLLLAYDSLDETGRRVFSCAFLHIWARHSAWFFGQEAAKAGGHLQEARERILALPPSSSFGDALELPLPGLFED